MSALDVNEVRGLNLWLKKHPLNFVVQPIEHSDQAGDDDGSARVQ